MLGTYHIIHYHAQYTTRRIPYYVSGPNHRRKTRLEEIVKSVCGETLVVNKDQFCNLSIVTPSWNYDWCHDCVRAFPWKENARKVWLKKGIESMDLPSWDEWINTPEGEYANPESFT